jgi:acyl-CoA synthetase (NDP forming)
MNETINALEKMFHPKAVAVVGAPRTRPSGWPGIFGCIKDYGFPGRLYPVNPGADEVEGVRAWPNLRSLPEPVDLVVISLPAPAVPEALRDCAASGNKNIHIFSAGFKETGEEEGLRLHGEIENIARREGLRVIGPNCMGIHVPSEGFVTWVGASKKSGPVAFVSQSGGHSQDFTSIANRLELYFSKVISYGNALTIDSTDLLEYLAHDPETEIITMYLEGVKNGRRLFELVSDITCTKPVIILKAGLTEAGTRAVASHTGSLAGGEKIWKAFFRATGAVSAVNLDDMAYLAMAFRCLEGTEGLRTAVIGHGGGIAVAAADACSAAGLEMPQLNRDTQRKLRGWIPSGGNIIRNPVDAVPVFRNMDLFQEVLRTVTADPAIDMMIISLSLDWLFDIDEGIQIEKVAEYLAGPARQCMNGKPFVVSWRSYRNDPRIFKVGEKMESRLLKAKIPVYRNFEQAAGSLARWANFHLFQKSRMEQDELQEQTLHRACSGCR